MQRIGKILLLFLCIFFFVFFSCVKNGVLGRSCFLSAYCGAQTSMISLDKRTYRGSPIGTDQKFRLSTGSSTAAEGCWLVSHASRLHFLKSLTIKDIASTGIIVILKESRIGRSSYLLGIWKRMQPQVQSFAFLRILDCPRFSNRLQEWLFVGGRRHYAFILDACQRATFIHPVGILCCSYWSSWWKIKYLRSECRTAHTSLRLSKPRQLRIRRRSRLFVKRVTGKFEPTATRVRRLIWQG